MFMAKLNSAFRRLAISVTDKRVQTMNEFLTCIKLIKLHAWEKSFTSTIGGRSAASEGTTCSVERAPVGFIRFLGQGFHKGLQESVCEVMAVVVVVSATWQSFQRLERFYKKSEHLFW